MLYTYYVFVYCVVCYTLYAVHTLCSVVARTVLSDVVVRQLHMLGQNVL